MEQNQKPKTPAGAKPSPSKSTQPKEKKGSPALTIVLVILVLALGGAAGYLFMQNGDLEEKLSRTTTELSDKNDEVDRISLDLNAKIADYEELMVQYEQMGLDNTDLQAQKAELERERDAWKKSAGTNKASRDQMKRKLEKVIAQAELDRIQLQEELDRYKSIADSLGTEVETLVSDRAQMSDTIVGLQDKVKIASILKAETVKITFFSEKDKEVKASKTGYKSKSLARMTVDVQLQDNKVAKKDKKTFVMRLIEPSGSVLFNLQTGGGSFETAEGNTNFYTVKKELLFDNTGQQMTFNYAKGEEYEPGNYQVEIYGDGYLIGKSQFDIK